MTYEGLPSPAITPVRDVKLEMAVGGSGDPLLFLHPGEGIEFSAPFLRILIQRHRVFMPSHPGFGGTDLPETITTVDDLAYFYLDALERFDLRDVTLVGASFGAWIAAEIAVKCTRRIKAVTLISSVGAKFGDAHAAELADVFEVPPYDLWRLYYEDASLGGSPYSTMDEPQLLRFSRNRESFGMLAWSPLLHNPKLRSRLHRIDVPTAVVWGERDRVAPVDYGRRFAAAIPRANFHLIPNAGHYAHAERPEQVAAIVDDLVATRGGPQASPSIAVRRTHI